MKHRLATLICMSLFAGCAPAGPKVRTDGSVEPGTALIGLMTEGELDRVAGSTAAALRSSNIAASASAPVKIAPPDWINAADVPVDQPAAFIDAFTGMVNDRSGANVQFVRRPWVRDNASQQEVLASSDLRSRLSVLPDKKGSDRKRILRIEVLDGSGRPTFTHDESFSVVPTKVAKATKAAEKQQVKLEEAKDEYSQPIAETGEVRFVRGSLSSKVRISRDPPTRLPDGRLRYAAKFRPNSSKFRVALQLYFYDKEGNLVEVSRRVLKELQSGHATLIDVTSQLPANRCVILIDRY